MKIWWRRILALLAAALLTTALASLAHSLFVQAGLKALGVEIPLLARVTTILRDFIGLLLPLGGVTLVALTVGFSIAAFLKPRAGLLAPFAYPLAGWAAMALALLLMQLAYGFSPLAGARTAAGFLSMSLSGLAGGLLFAWMARRRV
ncbi:hypothetical protein L6Q21_14135 [Sandaracinobacter sp. RS1-74]|uniref:hypothetical protein n=1 Tax=Sandaracinobacteroides sayramensis TaxID=2913411 RepID=UPI001EDC0A45|nr:hypothetical protein [Sandaracinobacteroides sayramensis]MCG2842124.1 hypothetical protein [Sandaracinobacteroides sayramensis]